MIFTPASTRSSATPWAASVGTARTPTTTSSSRITRSRSSYGRTTRFSFTLVPTLAGEDVRPGDRLAQVAGAEQGDVVLARAAEDLADLRDERVHVVAHAALAELAEAGQVAADLGRVHVRVVGQLLRGDGLATHLLRLGQDLEIAREAGGNAPRQAPGS